MQARRAELRSLVQRLQSGSADERDQAALSLYELLAHNEANERAVEAIASDIAAAGGILGLLRMLGSPDGEPGGGLAAPVLCVLAYGSPARCQAIIEADGGIAALIGCMAGTSQMRPAAAEALVNIASPRGGGAAATAAIAAAGGTDVAIRCLGSSGSSSGHGQDLLLRNAARLLGHLADNPEWRRAIAADGLPPLVRLLKHTTPEVAAEAAGVLSVLTVGQGSAPCISALQSAGGIAALVDALAASSDADTVELATIVLLDLMLAGQAAAVAAADPTSTLAAAFERLQLPGTAFSSTPQARAKVTEGRRLLAAARRSMPAASAAAPAGQAEPALVCAAPGCGATGGLRLCAGCGSLRYCGEACMRAHWPEHRPECKRLRAAAAGGPALVAAADQPATCPLVLRVCATPGCGATAHLRRCTACGSARARYCSEACVRAHWPEHRPECRRLRAAAAAAAEAGQA